MDNAMLIGLSRQTALRRELDVIANNIANIGTNGYKSQHVAFEQFIMPVARAEEFPFGDQRLRYVQDRGTWQDFASGPIQNTGNPLDLAIAGDGFFAVQTPQGERYTRNGGFQVDAEGFVVTAMGHRVLGTEGPIQLAEDESGLTIAADGSISTSLGDRGRLRLFTVGNPQTLVSEGDSLYRATEQMTELPPAATRIIQGSLEKSNVEPVLAVTRMMEVTRSYQTLASMMQRSEDLRRGAIERLADVPA